MSESIIFQRMEHRARKLKEWRILGGWSRIDLAAKLKIHPNTLDMWESAPVGIPRSKLEKLVELGFPARVAGLSNEQ